jgi:hypothetical protein
MRHGGTNARGTFGTSGPRTRGDRNAGFARRPPRPTILIVCEGAKTEPNYFSAFRVATHVRGVGMNPLNVVMQAACINDDDGPFDQVWCVFDHDEFPPSDFDNAILKARSKGFRAAYSNEAFELWYVLHFEYLQSAISRDRYIDKLSEHLDRKYEKNDTAMYEALRELEAIAMENATKLRKLHGESVPPSRCCPITTVDELVRVLRKVQADRGY